MGGGPRGLSEAVLGATALLGSIGTCQPQTHTGAATAGIAGMEQGMFLVPHVETTQVDGIKGYTSFTISASPTPAPPGDLHPEAKNIYAIFGDEDRSLSIPAAYHVPPPFGCDIVSCSPLFLPPALC